MNVHQSTFENCTLLVLAHPENLYGDLDDTQSVLAQLQSSPFATFIRSELDQWVHLMDLFSGALSALITCQTVCICKINKIGNSIDACFSSIFNFISHCLTLLGLALFGAYFCISRRGTSFAEWNTIICSGQQNVAYIVTKNSTITACFDCDDHARHPWNASSGQLASARWQLSCRMEDGPNNSP